MYQAAGWIDWIEASVALMIHFKIHETGTTLIDRTIQAASINVGVLTGGSRIHNGLSAGISEVFVFIEVSVTWA